MSVRTHELSTLVSRLLLFTLLLPLLLFLRLDPDDGLPVFVELELPLALRVACDTLLPSDRLLALLAQQFGRRFAILRVDRIEQEVVDDLDVAVELARGQRGWYGPDQPSRVRYCGRKSRQPTFGKHDETPDKLTFVAFPAQETHQEFEMGIDRGCLLDLGVGAKVDSMLRKESERGFRRSFEARGLLAQVFIRLAFDRRGASVRVRSTVGSQDNFGPSGGNEGELLAVRLTRLAPRQGKD